MPREDTDDRDTPTSPVLILALLALAMCLSALGTTEQPISPMTQPAPPAAPAAQTLRDGQQIDLNTASESDLQLLPRVGPAIAARIVEARPFDHVDSLVRVSGIGERTLERLRPHLTVRGTRHDAGPESSEREVRDFDRQ